MNDKATPLDKTCPHQRQRALLLYYALKSSDDAYFSFIPRQQLLYAVWSNKHKHQPIANAKKSRRRYDCQTQLAGTLEWRLRSAAGAPLALWASGTVLRWVARASVPGVPGGSAAGAARALRVAVDMWRAAEYWNGVMGGRLSFRYADELASADIILQPGSATSGFFPDNNALISTLTYAPEAGYWDLVHELAHVVGLPHENSHAVHPEWSHSNSNGNNIWLGTCDMHSVAGYHAGNPATDNDTQVIRNAYNTLQDGEKLSATIGGGKFTAKLTTVVRRISAPSSD